jgi:hypothetical protein
MPPPNVRGRGQCRALNAPAASCARVESTQVVTTGTQIHPSAFPAQWFLRLIRALPGVPTGVPGLMATVARKSTLKSPYLIKASGDQDHAAFAVRFTLRSSREAKASIASRLNVRDDAYAPDRGGTCAENHVFLKNGSRIFLSGRLDAYRIRRSYLPVGEDRIRSWDGLRLCVRSRMLAPRMRIAPAHPLILSDLSDNQA